MTKTTVVSIKMPARILDQIPAAGRGRSGFILQAIEEKLTRRRPEPWEPRTKRGRRLAALLAKGRTERAPLLANAQVDQELATRRGAELLKTFLDSGVLLHAWRGETLAHAALRILDDDARQFVTSQMVRLELLPKPQFEKRPMEMAFYEAHFADCTGCEPLSAELGRDAEKLAARHGMAGPDALQIAAAIRQGAAEFYTSEKPGKPMFRVKEIKVISLFSLLD